MALFLIRVNKIKLNEGEQMDLNIVARLKLFLILAKTRLKSGFCQGVCKDSDTFGFQKKVDFSTIFPQFSSSQLHVPSYSQKIICAEDFLSPIKD